MAVLDTAIPTKMPASSATSCPEIRHFHSFAKLSHWPGMMVPGEDVQS